MRLAAVVVVLTRVLQRGVRLDRIELGYGRSEKTVSRLGTAVVLETEQLVPADLASEETLVRHALRVPEGMVRLRQLLHRGDTVAVVVSDVTRPCPTSKLLPEVLRELAAACVDVDDVRIVFALGSHRGLTSKERSSLVGQEVYHQYSCLDTVNGPFVEVGCTSRGTPVQVLRPIVEATWRVLIGNIEYHYFAGYTGGAKALLPGVCSLETITANHSWMVDEDACASRIEGNPVREDIEEASALVGPSFLLNVVLDNQHRIREAVAGDVRLAHRRGCQTVDRLYRAVLTERAEIVLASAGGWPKDINLYQAHKALENAARAVRDDGILILVAACNEGIGHRRFAEWLTSGDSPEELLGRIRERFVLGGHKAAAIAKTLRRGVRVFLVSSLEAELVRGMGFTPFESAQEALDAARNERGHSALLALMPHAGSTMPVVAES